MGQVMSAIRASIRAFNVFPLLLSQFCYAAYSDTKQESDNVFNEIFTSAAPQPEFKKVLSKESLPFIISY
jgi:hypothetical protein